MCSWLIRIIVDFLAEEENLAILRDENNVYQRCKQLSAAIVERKWKKDCIAALKQYNSLVLRQIPILLSACNNLSSKLLNIGLDREITSSLSDFEKFVFNDSLWHTTRSLSENIGSARASLARYKSDGSKKNTDSVVKTNQGGLFNKNSILI